MGLAPDAYWKMTPAELAAMAEGYRWRQEREWERAAWMVANLLSPYVKKPLTIDRLLGREKVRTKADKERDFEALWGRLHPKG